MLRKPLWSCWEISFGSVLLSLLCAALMTGCHRGGAVPFLRSASNSAGIELSLVAQWHGLDGRLELSLDPSVTRLLPKPGSMLEAFESFENAEEAVLGLEPPPHSGELKLIDLVNRLRDHVQFDGRKVLYTWIGGTRRDWRGQGHFRALTEQQEAWAMEQGFDEIVVKTKNKFYEMRGTLDHLRFEVVKYERDAADNAESKVYLSKKLHPEVLGTHRSTKTVVQATL